MTPPPPRVRTAADYINAAEVRGKTAMRIVTFDEFCADMNRIYPDAAWIAGSFFCDHCKQRSNVLAWFEYCGETNEQETYQICATCLRAALDGVKAAPAPPLTPPPPP